jgi:hypothetical protein
MGIGGLLTRGCQPEVVGCAAADRIERRGTTGEGADGSSRMA